MPRHRRIAPDGFPHHVINRGNNRATIFHKAGDYAVFLSLMCDAARRVPMRVLAFCLMRNHFHFVLWPRHGIDLSAYMQWLMTAHIARYRAHYQLAGQGHIYQGRFKNFMIESDRHLLIALRYVEGNPQRAGLVTRAQDWEWSSLSTVATGARPQLTEGPVSRPANWSDLVNGSLNGADLDRLRRSVKRGAPFGSASWVYRTAQTHHLLHTVRDPWRPPSEDKMMVE